MSSQNILPKNKTTRSYLVISPHAVEQCIDRVLSVRGTRDTAIRCIYKLFYSGVPYGISYEKDFMLKGNLTEGSFVLACTKDGSGRIVVKTVLTEQQAECNMQFLRRFTRHGTGHNTCAKRKQ